MGRVAPLLDRTTTTTTSSAAAGEPSPGMLAQEPASATLHGSAPPAAVDAPEMVSRAGEEEVAPRRRGRPRAGAVAPPPVAAAAAATAAADAAGGKLGRTQRRGKGRSVGKGGAVAVAGQESLLSLTPSPVAPAGAYHDAAAGITDGVGVVPAAGLVATVVNHALGDGGEDAEGEGAVLEAAGSDEGGGSSGLLSGSLASAFSRRNPVYRCGKWPGGAQGDEGRGGERRGGTLTLSVVCVGG